MVTESEAVSVGLADFHLCRRWWDRNMKCPMTVFREHVRDPRPVEDPDFKVPEHVLFAIARAREERSLDRFNVLAQAEEVVAAAAPAIGIPIEEPEALPEGVPVSGRSLAEGLREEGPVAVGVGVAAGLAIRAVAKGFAGGGFHFPQVFDPFTPLRVR